MKPSSAGPPPEEFFLPFDSPGGSPASPVGPRAEEPPGEVPLVPPPMARRRSRTGEPGQPVPDPRTWAEEACHEIQRRQAETLEGWGEAVDVLTRQLSGEVSRLETTGAEATRTLRSTVDSVGASVGTLAGTVRAELEAIGTAVQAQTAALEKEVSDQGRLLVGSTREAASHITVARHELAQSVDRLRRSTLRYVVLLGGGTALLVLLLARWLWPFWGMSREDMEAWSQGARLRETYRQAPPTQQRAILQALEWRSMPGPAARSASSASPPAGR
ncbi:MAG: hypothetical protein JWM27_2070 [Gemmatimonadetes bacterium]|nr:hypothetical protein [Gemmatimonadota bacterium]